MESIPLQIRKRPGRHGHCHLAARASKREGEIKCSWTWPAIFFLLPVNIQVIEAKRKKGAALGNDLSQLETQPINN